MASFDARMAEYFKRFVVPLAAVLIILRILAFIYQKIFPYGYVWVCKKFGKKHHRALKALKDKLFSDIASIREDPDSNNALEIGCGPGNNFGVYPPNTSLIVVEPNAHFQKSVTQNASQHPTLEISQFLTMGAEDLKEFVPSASQDAVVSTLTLCSVQDLEAVIREVYRILRPGGRFYFIEHTAAHRNSWLYFFQRMLAPFFQVIAKCNLITTPWTVVDRAGFSKVLYTKTDLVPVPFFVRPHLIGFAVK